MMTHSGWCRVSQTPGLDITTFCDCHVKQIVEFESALAALQQRLAEAERDYQKIISAVLECNPVPAVNRPDD